MTKLDPIEELVAASVLMRPSKARVTHRQQLDGFTFSNEKLCERVLLRELKRQILPRPLPTADEFMAWMNRAEGGRRDAAFSELVAALESFAGGMVEAGDVTVLPAVLDSEHTQTRDRVLGAAIRALGPSWGPTESGAPGVSAVLEGLVERAMSGTTYAGEVFEDVAGSAVCWLQDYGYSGVAVSVCQCRIAVLHRLVGRAPSRADLRLRHGVATFRLGQLNNKLGNHAFARTCFESSLVTLRQVKSIGTEQPSSVLLSILAAHGELAKLAAFAGDATAAGEIYEVVLGELHGLHSAGAERSRAGRALSVTYNDLGHLAREAGLPDLASQHFAASLAIMRDLIGAAAGDFSFREDLAIALNNVGLAARDAKRWEEAHDAFQEALRHRRLWLAEDPANLNARLSLSAGLGNLGHLLRDLGEIDRARESYFESMEILRRIVEVEPSRVDYRKNLAVALSDWDGAEVAAGREPNESGALTERLAHLRVLLAASDKDPERQWEVACCLADLGHVARRGGDIAQARRLSAESVGVLQGLCKVQPAVSRYQIGLAAACWNAYAVTSNRAEEVRFLRMELDVLHDLRVAACGDARITPWWAEASAALAERER